ncbi:MAG: YihY/virulence factor BrkB family protein [Mogibacterium sp.]|nr:YihY/virulence factor BrkB family protein [Mogibacterium sp.]
MSDFWDDKDIVAKEEGRLSFNWAHFKKICFHLWRQFDDPYYEGFAAQIAYFFLMSAVPMLIVATQVLGVFDISMDFIRLWLERHLSSEMSEFMKNIFSASSAALPNLIMIILVLWASSSLAFSLSRLTTYTLSYGRYRYNFLAERIRAIPMTLTTILVVAVGMVVYVYGELITHRIFQNELIMKIISGSRTPIMGLVFFLMILSAYYVLPRIRVPMMAVMPGAVVATAGILIVTWLYSLYTARAAKYNLLYGAFSNIVAMMLWFYLISWVLCIGMMFNKSWDIVLRRGRLTPGKIKEYLIRQYGAKGEERFNQLIIDEYDMTDRTLDSLAVRMSRRFDPGYQEKREREILELKQERRFKQRIEKVVETRIEEASRQNDRKS